MNQAILVEQLRQWTGFLWIALLLVWAVSALATKRTIQRQSRASRILHSGVLVIGAYLLFTRSLGIPWLDRQLFPVTASVALAGFVAALLGVAFSVWARFILGSNWSGLITVKENHTLVRRGPYRIVRHPIYTGILLALIGSALQRGAVRSFIGVVLCGFAFWLKTQIEERFMVQRFGEEYLRYRHEVKALAPFIF
jgi:protein-S-isoprenylcysteine O-methyltransferase Ste14